MSTSVPSGIDRMPRRTARSTFLPIDRPSVATRRPLATAASTTCWIRWMWLAKQATMTRWPAAATKTRRIVAPTVLSDGVKPGSSAFVESASSSRTPGPDARAPIRARSVRRPSTGSRSSLKSPECRRTPWGVWKAMAKPWGTEWVTGMNSTSNGPMRRRSPSVTVMYCARSVEPGLVDPVAGQAEREGRAVDRDGQVAQQERQSAGVVLVTVGQHDAVDAVGVLPQVREVGKDEVDAGHVGVGEHDPAVEDEDPAVDLDAGAVAADLAEAAEEDDADRLGPGGAGGPGGRGPSGLAGRVLGRGSGLLPTLTPVPRRLRRVLGLRQPDRLPARRRRPPAA